MASGDLGAVDRHFKPAGQHYGDLHIDEEHSLEQRMELLEERLALMESGRATVPRGLRLNRFT